MMNMMKFRWMNKRSAYAMLNFLKKISKCKLVPACAFWRLLPGNSSNLPNPRNKNSACLRFQSRDDCLKKRQKAHHHHAFVISFSMIVSVVTVALWQSMVTSKKKSMETNFQNCWKTNGFHACNHNSSLYPGPFNSMLFTVNVPSIKRYHGQHSNFPRVTYQLRHLICSWIRSQSGSRPAGFSWNLTSAEIHRNSRSMSTENAMFTSRASLVVFLCLIDGQGPRLGKNVFPGTS